MCTQTNTPCPNDPVAPLAYDFAEKVSPVPNYVFLANKLKKSSITVI